MEGLCSFCSDRELVRPYQLSKVQENNPYAEIVLYVLLGVVR